VDISEKLPKDYFEDAPIVVELEEESLYGQFEPQQDNELESIYDLGYKEEEESAGSVAQTPILQNNQSIKINTPDYVDEGEEQKFISSKDVIEKGAEPDTDVLLEKIKNIDDKLFNLEKSLYDPNSANPVSLNKIEEVYNNFFKDEMVTRDFSSPNNITNIDDGVIFNKKEEVNPDYVKNDSLFSQENFATDVSNLDESIIEINNNKQENFNDNINNEITKLNNERNELIKNLNVSKNVKSQNNLYNNNAFVPNFQYNNTEQDDSIKKSILTEQIFNGGDEVKMVSDDEGSPAIISKDQINLQNAIKEHGGVENAIRDSAEKQNFVNKTFKNDVGYNSSSTSFFNNTTNTDNSNLNSSSVPNSFDQITRNTFNTVAAIKELSNNMSSLLNSLNKNFSGLNGSLKELKSSQNNIVNNINNNKNYSSNSNNMGSNTSPSGNIIPNVRGNTPLSTDLPDGMVMRGSNLTNRFNE